MMIKIGRRFSAHSPNRLVGVKAWARRLRPGCSPSWQMTSQRAGPARNWCARGLAIRWRTPWLSEWPEHCTRSLCPSRRLLWSPAIPRARRRWSNCAPLYSASSGSIKAPFVTFLVVAPADERGRKVGRAGRGVSADRQGDGPAASAPRNRRQRRPKRHLGSLSLSSRRCRLGRPAERGAASRRIGTDRRRRSTPHSE